MHYIKCLLIHIPLNFLFIFYILHPGTINFFSHQVKPVSYLMINSDTRLRSTAGYLSTVPRGTTLQFTVTYHDDVGATFYATNIDMKFRCSR